MMNPIHDLFIGTLDDMEAKLRSPTVYNRVRLSALLRQLLLDGEPLIDRVNRDFRLRIRFEVTDPPPILRPDDRTVIWIEADGIAPHPDLPGFGRKSVKRDELLARHVAKVGPHYYSVHDLIDQVAHVAGGVHAGVPDSDVLSRLTTAGELVIVFGAPMAIGLLPPVARVVLDGLAPLRAAVTASR